MSDFRQTITDPVVCEQTTALLTLQLTDENNLDLAGSQIFACTLTLYDHRKLSVTINGRAAQDIKNANGGIISSDGVLALTLSKADNTLTSQQREEVQRVALIEYTWSAGTKYGKKEITYTVINQPKVS